MNAEVFTYDLGSSDPDLVQVSLVRLLLNDVDEATAVFSDAEIAAFLVLEGNAVKLAAAQAIDTNADDQALASKVLRTQDLSTDGAKVADSLRKRAQALRDQHTIELDDADEGYFEVVDIAGRQHGPEMTAWPYF